MKNANFVSRIVCFVPFCSLVYQLDLFHKSFSCCSNRKNTEAVFMRKSEVDELFVLHHQDLGLSDEELDDLLEESSWQQRARWLNAHGYSAEEEDND